MVMFALFSRSLFLRFVGLHAYFFCALAKRDNDRFALCFMSLFVSLRGSDVEHTLHHSRRPSLMVFCSRHACFPVAGVGLDSNEDIAVILKDGTVWRALIRL